MRVYQAISGVVLSISAVATIGFMLHASEGQFSIGHLGFILWALAPYVLILVMMIALKSRRNQLALDISVCIASLVLLAISLVVYTESVLSSSSTAALIFVFVPCYLLAGGPLIVGLCFLVGRLLLPQGYHSDDDSLCTKCGYNLTGNMSGRCLECGQPISDSTLN